MTLRKADGSQATKLLLDPKTHLLFRMLHDEDGQDAVEEYADYRSVDGIAIPFHEHVEQGKEAFDVVVSTVRLNTGVSDAVFVKGAPAPAALQSPLPPVAVPLPRERGQQAPRESGETRNGCALSTKHGQFVWAPFQGEIEVSGQPDPVSIGMFSDGDVNGRAKRFKVYISVTASATMSTATAMSVAGTFIRRVISRNGLTMRLGTLKSSCASKTGTFHVLSGWVEGTG